MSTLIVNSVHLRTIPYFRQNPGFCLPKARAWFKRQGLDWKSFLREGIDAEVLLATGDGMAIALVDWARESEASHGQ